MGNLFSKKNQVTQLPEGKKTRRKETVNRPSKRWYKSMLCCNRNAVEVLTRNISDKETADTAEVCCEKSDSDLDLATECNLELQDCADDDSTFSLDTFKVSNLHKLELPQDKTPLPRIDVHSNGQIISSGLTVRRNHNGRASAIAYDVELLDDYYDVPNRPQSCLSMGNPAYLPEHLRNKLPALPAVSKETIDRRWVYFAHLTECIISCNYFQTIFKQNLNSFNVFFLFR